MDAGNKNVLQSSDAGSQSLTVSEALNLRGNPICGLNTFSKPDTRMHAHTHTPHSFIAHS